MQTRSRFLKSDPVHTRQSIVLALLSLGLTTSHTKAMHLPRQDAIASDAQAHVLILPGITGGFAHDPQRFADAIARAYPDGVSFQIWDWTKVELSLRIISNRLLDDQRNRHRAAILAQQIAEWRKENPDTRLIIVAMSGGGRIAHFLCDDPTLPPGQLFDAVILLSVAVPQNWDIEKAATRSKRGLFNYSSENDTVLETAKWVGVSKPIGLCGVNEDTDEIKELRWNPSMRKLNNSGGHLNCTKRPFVDECVMPLIRHDVLDWPDACLAAKK